MRGKMMSAESNVMVSVIMPVYNVEQYIDRAVASVLSQSFQDFEIILSDDGSTDSSGILCDHYAAMDSRIKVLHHENSGVGPARNAGLQIAKGKYIYFMDPDDSIEKDLLKDNIGLAEKYSCDEVIFGFVSEICDKHDVCIKRKVYLHNLSGLYDFNTFQKDYMPHLKNVPFAVWNRIYSRRLLDGIRFDGINTAEDAVFNLSLEQKGFSKIYYHNKAYYTYYGRADSLMNKFNPKRFENEALITDIIWGMVSQWGKTEEFEKYLSYRYMESLLNEYNNMAMPDCPLSNKQMVERIKALFSDTRIVDAAARLSNSDIPYITARICFILSKRGHFYIALLFRRYYTPVSRFVYRILTKIKRK